MSETNTETSTEVVQRFDPADLRAIANYDDAIRLLTESGVTLRDATTEIGDGFILLENKDELLGRQFVVLHAAFAKGDYGDDTEYCILRVVSAAGKFVVTDGGTGIVPQMRDYISRNGNAAGLVCPRGLRKSEYDTDINGKPTTDKSLAVGKGTTYYLNV